MRTQRTYRLLILTVLLLVVAKTTYSQTAQITGRVIDSSGAVVPGAELTLTHTSTGTSRKTVSNQEGIYTIPFLSPGQCQMTVQMTGFRPVRREGIVLSVDEVARLDFVLTVGDVVEEVTVESTAPLLERETSSVGQVIDNKTIVTLPLNGRNYVQLAMLTPGATPTPNARAPVSFSLDGNRILQNTFFIDGLDNNSYFIGGDTSTQAVQPSIDAIQEFKVETASYSAEYGRSAGGIINVAIKSGTNNFHGSAFEFLRNDKLDANDFFANRAGLERSPLRFNQFGGTLGGPVLRNRTFFFASYQGLRDHRSVTRTTTVPTPEMVRGNFGRVNIYDPLNVVNGVRQQFPNNIIPEARMDPVGRRLAALYPAPNQPGSVNNYVADVAMLERADEIDARGDHHFRSSDTTFVRASWSDRKSNRGSLFGPPGNGGVGAGQFPVITPFNAFSIVAGETHVFSAVLANEVRIGVSKNQTNRQSPVSRPLFDEFGIKGIPALDGLNGLPQFTVQSFSSLGDGAFTPAPRQVSLLQMSDNLSWNRGNHTRKFGIDFRLKKNRQNTSQSARSQITFNGQFTSRVPGQGTGSSLADLLLGQSSTALLSTPNVADLRDHYYGIYGTDTWKVAPKLTLNLGLRYELQTPVWERDNQMANFDLTRNSPTYGTVVLAKDGSFRDRTFSNLDTNNFAPRLGLAYQLDPKTVIRSSFGIFYGGFGFHQGGPTNIPFSISVTFSSPTTAAVSNLVLSNGFPADTLDLRRVVNPSAVALLEDSPRAEVYQWNLGVQREFLHSSVLTLSYVGSSSAHLRGWNDINAPAPGPGDLNRRRLFPSFGGIALRSDFVHATYHALQTKLERRFSRGFSLLASYTWSHAIDDSQDNEDPMDGPSFPQNPQDNAAEKADSGYDLRDRFVTSVIYDWPIGRPGGLLGGSKVIRALVGGFQLAGIFVAQTGPILNPSVNGNPANVQDTGPIRPDRLRDGNLPGDQRTLNRWFDPTAFRSPAPFTFGNSGRNVLRGPGLVNLDLLLARNFPFTESKRLELRGEFFNFTNTAHFAKPNAVIGSPQAGQITSTSMPNRQIQIGLRFVF